MNIQKIFVAVRNEPEQAALIVAEEKVLPPSGKC